jgi:hypothetical protein
MFDANSSDILGPKRPAPGSKYKPPGESFIEKPTQNPAQKPMLKTFPGPFSFIGFGNHQGGVDGTAVVGQGGGI